ncbi:hypothetical protein [Hymenobacter sp. PAMC 26628]|uniref:hypothetical protein n=1 Tax=Hymenobacter sp. PAMC 26628 TaxID=1484118 RepID=UPI000A58E6DC|nr:hypothetical protein [Hymenobacter sp. PAMC 26628]
MVNRYPFDYDTRLSLASTYPSLGKKAEARARYNRTLLIRPGGASATARLRHLP